MNWKKVHRIGNEEKKRLDNPSSDTIAEQEVLQYKGIQLIK